MTKQRINRSGTGQGRPYAPGVTLIQLMVIIGLIGIVAAVVVRMLLERMG